MEFTIDRSKWRCGSTGNYAKGLGETSLLNREGYMCCLGQISKQLGFNDSELNGLSSPYELNLDNGSVPYRDDTVGLFTSCDNYETTLTNQAIDINDNHLYTTIERERSLKRLFTENDIKLKFINKSVKFNIKSIML